MSYMRIPRGLQLFTESGGTHMMWRCHNEDYYLRPSSIKDLYLEAVRRSLKDKVINENVKIHAYCIMDNHYHQLTTYSNTSEHLSNFMRKAHTIFGLRYNRLFERSGKVSEGRPKTSLIQDEDHEIRVQFYIEANPIRAGMCTAENLRRYRYNTFRLYAYGIRDKYTDFITIPDWYIKLGSTPGERQRKYRKLFYAYLAETDSNTSIVKFFEGPLIGSEFWIYNQRIQLFSRIKRDTS